MCHNEEGRGFGVIEKKFGEEFGVIKTRFREEDEYSQDCEAEIGQVAAPYLWVKRVRTSRKKKTRMFP